MRSEKISVGLYARVSTKDGQQEVENQLGQLRQYCRKQGWRIYREYVDQESGGTAKRPEFLQLFEDARLRHFDLVLFWSLDRFSREGVTKTLTHLERLTGYGAGWKSFSEEYLDSCGAFKDAVLAILACIAKQERVRISERTKAGLERLRAQGKTLGRPYRILDLPKMRRLREEGLSLAAIGKQMKVCPCTVLRRLRSVSEEATK